MTKFKILSVKGNSVRVSVGTVTFDVKVGEIDGRLRVQIPKNIFIPNKEDYDDLVGVVVGIFEKDTTGYGDTTNYGQRYTISVDRR